MQSGSGEDPKFLSESERNLANELERLDPRLATLLVEGLRLAGELPRPGIGLLIAHAGRELSRGVVAALEESSESALTNHVGSAEQQQRNRGRIARVLGLPFDDPRVTRWFELVENFGANCHYRVGSSPAIDIAREFREFTAILFGRIGPYFEAQSLVDTLLSCDAPESRHIDLLRAPLGRPALRRYFFEQVKSAGWLPLLVDANLLAPPPQARVDPEGRTTMVGWPEGACLVRFASAHPAIVCDFLESIPTALDNLAVWRDVIEAALKLPPAFSSRLAGRVCVAIRQPYSRFFSLSCFPLVRYLAENGADGSFDLMRALLSLRKRPQETGTGDSAPRARFYSETGPELEILDKHGIGELFKEAVPALIAQDPRRAFELFHERLRVAIKSSTAPSPHSPRSVSKTWCRDLEDPDDDPRSMLATVLLTAARAVASRGEPDARWVHEKLGEEEHEIFRRADIMVLAEAGAMVPDLLEDAMCASDFLDAPWGDRESAALLRRQFANAPSRARKLLVHSVTRGPDSAHLSAVLGFRAVDDPSEQEVGAEIDRWQRGRLLWFEEGIPPDFAILAAKLDVEGKTATLEERCLAYDGFYSGGVSWRGETSPLSDSQLEAMSPVDLVDYLREWEPSSSRFDGPSRRGLLEALQGLASREPTRGEEIAQELIQRADPPSGAIESILEGWRRADEAGTMVGWEQASSLVEFALQRLSDSNEGRKSHEPARSAARFIQRMCHAEGVPAADAQRLWGVVTRALHAENTWATGVEESPTSFDGVLSIAINTLAGDLVGSLMSLALLGYRREVERAPVEENERTRARDNIATQLIPVVEDVLRRRGRAGIAAQATFGWYVPQLWLIAPEWFGAACPVLFDNGVQEPLASPLWGAYLTRGHYYSALFPMLRPWYAESARLLDTAQAETETSWSLFGHLVTHALIAMVRGDAAVGDPDRLVETTFDRAPLKHRTNAYWEIFRGWSDSDEPPPTAALERLAAFWRWRLERLESGPDTKQRATEASGLAWFVVTPHLLPKDVLPLTRRTILLSATGERIPGLWTRLSELVPADSAAVMDLVELSVEFELKRDYSHLPVDEVGPVLTPLLHSDDRSIHDRAERVINLLGERYSNDYRSLLGEERS